MKRIVLDGIECDPGELFCWTAAYGAAFSGEVLALVRHGTGFDRALKIGDGEAAQMIADAAVRALRQVPGLGSEQAESAR